MTLQMANIREHAHALTIAGQFFPATSAELSGALDLAERQAAPGYARPWQALIAPHAGYRFSGAVAASVYRTTTRLRQTCQRVILLSPAHKLRFDGMAVLDAATIATPLGNVSLDDHAQHTVLQHKDVRVLSNAFDREHGIETHLPFIQRYLPEARILPIVVGRCSDKAVSDVVRPYAGASDTLLIVSTDLSHFHPLHAARRLDATTCQRIEQLAPDHLSSKNACGVVPLRGLLRLAREKNWRVTRFDSRTSADAGAGPDRVVGYAAFGLENADTARLPDKHRKTLLRIADQSLHIAVTKKITPTVKLDKLDPSLATHRRVFVTLTRNGRLRGCKGSQGAHLPLAQAVATFTAQSALSDPRFKPIDASELERLEISISIPSEETPLACTTKDELIAALKPGRDGLTISGKEFRATFLPAVWKKLSKPEDFVAALIHKAGLKPDAWPSGIQCSRYSSESFGASA